jgi:C-terminal processing protease CtpA/Prc
MGRLFEVMGVKPDIEAQPSPQDIRHGNDVILKQAVELAHKLIRNPEKKAIDEIRSRRLASLGGS